MLAANKVDEIASRRARAVVAGLGEPHPVSALHGRGSGDLLDAVLDALPEAPRTARRGGRAAPGRAGRAPNVGKSSLLNRLAGQHRVVVDEVAGTTGDPVDSLVELGGETWRFVDTAGIRRGPARARARSTTRRCAPPGRWTAEVAVVLSTPGSRSPSRTSDRVHGDRGRSGAGDRVQQVGSGRRGPASSWTGKSTAIWPARWAPRVNISAKTGRQSRSSARHELPWTAGNPGAHRPAQRLAHRGRRATPPPSRGGRAPKVLFATQADIRPPSSCCSHGIPGSGVPAIPRAAAAGGVRLHGQPDRGVGAAA